MTNKTSATFNTVQTDGY